MTRDDARQNGGLIGRYPDEPEALVELLELGTDVRELGDDHVGFTVDARAASRAGAPTAGPVDTTLPMEVWVGDDGEPRRIAYRIEQAATAALPARTIVVTYELADLGDPVSGLEFRRRPGDRGGLNPPRKVGTAGQSAGETPGGESRRKVAQKGDRRRSVSRGSVGKGETVG